MDYEADNLFADPTDLDDPFYSVLGNTMEGVCKCTIKQGFN